MGTEASLPGLFALFPPQATRNALAITMDTTNAPQDLLGIIARMVKDYTRKPA
jgi:hypothetical protein